MARSTPRIKRYSVILCSKRSESTPNLEIFCRKLSYCRFPPYRLWRRITIHNSLHYW